MINYREVKIIIPRVEGREAIYNPTKKDYTVKENYTDSSWRRLLIELKDFGDSLQKRSEQPTSKLQ